MNQSIVFLKGQKVTLRPVLNEDVPLLLRWVNDPEIRIFIRRVLPALEQHEHQWIQSLANKNEDVVFMIEAEGKPIGTMGIHSISWTDRTATTGAFIGEKEYWGKRYGTDAKMTLLNYAFNTLNLQRLTSYVKAFNERSLAYNLHCGYKVEGTLRRNYFVNGQYCDGIVLGLLKEEWLPHWEKYQKQSDEPSNKDENNSK